MPHLTRREIKKPDWFIQRVGRVRAGLVNNRKRAILVLVILIAAFAGFGFYRNERNHDEKEAATLFAKSYQQLEFAEQAMKRGAEEEKIEENKEGIPSDAMISIDPISFYQEAEKGFEEILIKYPHSKVTTQAALYLGAVHFKQNNFEKAIGAYEQAEKSARRNSLLQWEAQFGRAKSLEAAGKIPEAVSVFESIHESEASWLQSIVVENLFRLYLQSGQIEKADQLLKEVEKSDKTAMVNQFKGLRKLYEEKKP
ncbi:MAG: tetratricopeptide repeat protein [Deltaproteobacteria bacterium]|nr:tetratricopeptide repeat protein [Deltaproteobacteria bacterium]